jgi:WD40 repeat protein
LWNADTGEPRLPPIPTHGGNLLAFSPDGAAVATGGLRANVHLWDAATGRERLAFPGHKQEVAAVVFAPDGKSVASAAKDGAILIWDAATGTVEATCIGHKGAVSALAFAPDGKTLASGGEDRTIRLWDRSSGQEQTSLAGDGFVRFLAFTADGRDLVFASRGARGLQLVRVKSLAGARERENLLTAFSDNDCLAVTPDGKTLAVQTSSQSITVFDLVAGSPRLTVQVGVGLQWRSGISTADRSN